MRLQTSRPQPSRSKNFNEKLFLLALATLALFIACTFFSCRKPEPTIILEVSTYSEHGGTLKYIDTERAWHSELVGTNATRSIEILEADLATHVTLTSTWTGSTDSARIVVSRSGQSVTNAVRTNGYAAEVTVQPSEMK